MKFKQIIGGAGALLVLACQHHSVNAMVRANKISHLSPEFDEQVAHLFDAVKQNRDTMAKNASYIPALAEKDPHALGLSVVIGDKMINLGNTEDKFTIQSIGKVFTDITLHLTEQAPRIENIPILSFPSQPQFSLHSPGHKRDFPLATLGSEYSPFAFGSRKNLMRIEEQGMPRVYHIPNASVNLGALVTMGRIPKRALINGELVEGRFEIVKRVTENLMGRSLDLDQKVLQSELLETFKDRNHYLEQYHRRKQLVSALKTSRFGSLAEYQLIHQGFKNSYDWQGLAQLRSMVGKPEKVETIDNMTRALLANKHGFFGGRLPESEVEGIMTDYTKMCSLEVDTMDLARAGAIIGDGGWDPLLKQRVLPVEVAKLAERQMKNNGLYQQSNQQLAIKSGVGGGTMVAFPELGGAATLSRPLNAIGNSADGLRLVFPLERLSLQIAKPETF